MFLAPHSSAFGSGLAVCCGDTLGISVSFGSVLANSSLAALALFNSASSEPNLAISLLASTSAAISPASLADASFAADASQWWHY